MEWFQQLKTWFTQKQRGSKSSSTRRRITRQATLLRMAAKEKRERDEAIAKVQEKLNQSEQRQVAEAIARVDQAIEKERRLKEADEKRLEEERVAKAAAAKQYQSQVAAFQKEAARVQQKARIEMEKEKAAEAAYLKRKAEEAHAAELERQELKNAKMLANTISRERIQRERKARSSRKSPRKSSGSRNSYSPEGYVKVAEDMVKHEIARLNLRPRPSRYDPKPYFIPDFLKKYFSEIVPSVSDGTCLLHSFLLSTSPAYRSLNDQFSVGLGSDREKVGKAIRANLYQEVQNPSLFSSDPAEYMTDQALIHFCKRFGVNAIVLVQGQLIGYYDKLPNAPFTMIYYNGNHYDAMKSDSNFLIDRRTYNAILAEATQEVKRGAFFQIYEIK